MGLQNNDLSSCLYESPPTVRETQKLLVFQNKVPIKISGVEKEEQRSSLGYQTL